MKNDGRLPVRPCRRAAQKMAQAGLGPRLRRGKPWGRYPAHSVARESVPLCFVTRGDA